MIKIKDIAQMAGVSKTTVSKVLNNKADSISQEVKDKVLEIARKNNYIPYGGNLLETSHSFNIAYISHNLKDSYEVLNGITNTLSDSGYSLILFDSKNSSSDEIKNIAKAKTKKPDAIIWDPVDINNSQLLQDKEIVLCANKPIEGFNSAAINFNKLGYYATETLIKQGHKKILCAIVKDSLRSNAFLNGYKQCLSDNNIKYAKNDISEFGNINYEELLNNYTAIVASHFGLAQDIIKKLTIFNINIPRDISLISLRNDIREQVLLSGISTIKIPDYNFGEYLGKEVIKQINDRHKTNTYYNFKPFIESYDSIGSPLSFKNKTIIVVGSANVDNYLLLEENRHGVKTNLANDTIQLAGGKGLNEAIGIALLKKDVSLIAKIGKDKESAFLLKKLNEYDINCDYLISDERYKTGQSYITVDKNGDSQIIVSGGANRHLNKEEILNAEELFKNASMCVVSAEIPHESVSMALKQAKKYNLLTILKSSTAIDYFEDEDYKNTDYFIVNRREAYNISHIDDIEKAGKYFINKGIKNIIITLGKDGCLLVNKKKIKKYFAIKTNAIDATGASDAFIATLAARLSENYSLDDAIIHSNIAASFSITRFGSANSFIDAETLDRAVNSLRL